MNAAEAKALAQASTPQQRNLDFILGQVADFASRAAMSVQFDMNANVDVADLVARLQALGFETESKPAETVKDDAGNDVAVPEKLLVKWENA